MVFMKQRKSAGLPASDQEQPALDNDSRERLRPLPLQRRLGPQQVLLFLSLLLNCYYLRTSSTGTSLRLGKKELHVVDPPKKETNQQTQRKKDTANKDNKEDSTRPPRKVYVDLGANCGNTYLQRESKFEEEGGWEIYLWEPSPQMHEFFLNDLAMQHPNINILPYAAGVGHNATIQLYVHKGQEGVTSRDQFRDGGKCDPKSPYNPSGGTTMFSNAKVAGEPVDVLRVNFPEWLEGLALRAGVDQFNFKIDIEGAELDIMEALLSPPSNPEAPICAAGLIEMEFHKNIFQEGTKDYVKHEKFENDFNDMFEAKCGRPPTLKKLS